MRPSAPWGSITGSRSDGSPLTGTPVRLAIDAIARCVRGACGASCSDSTLTFRFGGNRYVFAAKGATLAYLSQWTASIVTLGSSRDCQLRIPNVALNSLTSSSYRSIARRSAPRFSPCRR